jgi:hypothetical protein
MGGLPPSNNRIGMIAKSLKEKQLKNSYLWLIVERGL